MCPKTEFNPPSTPCLTARHNKKLQLYLLFFVIFIVVYSPILALILIKIAYVVHMHTQFKMIEKKNHMKMIAVHSAAIMCLSMAFLQT